MFKSIIFLGALVACFLEPADAMTAASFKKLCNGENVDLNLITDVQALAEWVAAAEPGLCPEPLVRSLAELTPILDNVQEDACSIERVNKFRAFFELFLEDGPKVSRIPHGLRNFALGLGLNIASSCKDRMLHTLLEVSSSVEQIVDHRHYRQLFGGAGFLNIAFVGTGNYDELIESAAIQREASEQSAAPYIQVRDAEIVVGYQSICLKQLKPIYDQVLEPAVTLASLGFNFKGEENMKILAKDKQLEPWYRVIFFCEIINRFRFYELTKEDIAASGLDRFSVRLVSPEDVAKIDAIGLSKLPAVEPFEGPIEALQQPYRIDDDVLDSHNKAFVKEMDKLNGIRKGLLKKVTHSLKKVYKSGKRKLFGSLVAVGSGINLKGIKVASSRSNGPPRTLDEFLSEYERSTEDAHKPGAMSKLASSLGIKPESQKRFKSIVVNEYTLTASVAALVLAIAAAAAAIGHLILG